uniref:Uncharacterized protein n=1 Tax=Arundo donax TaxID=35708 RepID=A0A0A9DBW9_ARUDO
MGFLKFSLYLCNLSKHYIPMFSLLFAFVCFDLTFLSIFYPMPILGFPFSCILINP